MPTSIKIRSLHQEPDLAPELALWAYEEWYRVRDLAYDLVLKAYLARTRSGDLPQTLVALDGERPIGMVTLKMDDLWSRHDLNPWLSSLYVVPEKRRRGIAGELVRAVIGRARGLGFEGLYLFLGQADPDRLERYYVKRGWVIIGSAVDNDGFDTKIARFDLGRTPGH